MLLIIHYFLHDSGVYVHVNAVTLFIGTVHMQKRVNHNLRYEIATVRNKVETVRYKLNGCQCRKMQLCESHLGELKKLQL